MEKANVIQKIELVKATMFSAIAKLDEQCAGSHP
jgi:hypothetical protein